MNTAETANEAPVVFTSSAAAKVSELIKEEGNPDLMLRLYIQGGGCSGFQYGFTFDEQIEEGDSQVEELADDVIHVPVVEEFLQPIVPRIKLTLGAVHAMAELFHNAERECEDHFSG